MTFKANVTGIRIAEVMGIADPDSQALFCVGLIYGIMLSIGAPEWAQGFAKVAHKELDELGMMPAYMTEALMGIVEAFPIEEVQ